jgi:hypothetical protein
MKAVILGTGATIGTLGKIGGVIGFEKRLTEIHPRWKRDYPDLERAIRDCKNNNEEKIDLDKLWTRIDYYSKFSNILKILDFDEYGPKASIDLRKAILNIYSFKEEINQICTSRKDFTLKLELRELRRGDALISFNWDTLAENIVMKMLWKNLVQVPDPDSGRHIRLIKPHGSVSWVHKSDGNVIFQEGSKTLLSPMTEKDVHNGHNGAEPLVLGTVPVKSELLREIQKCHPKVFETISYQWSETLKVISQAEEVVVLGYSFPKEDTYGRFLLQEAVRKRLKNDELPKVRYYALPDDRCKIEKAFREIFSNKVNYKYMGKVNGPSPNSHIFWLMKWILTVAYRHYVK